VYVARVRNGFLPATRRTVFAKLKSLVRDKCVRQPARNGTGSLGRDPRCGEDEEVRLGSSEDPGRDGVFGVD
jgi:hypothetical protein